MMRHRKHDIHKQIVFGLVLSLLLSGLPPMPVLADNDGAVQEGSQGDGTEDTDIQPERELIEIYDIEDLQDFAAKCDIDSWSKNKEVHLKADLNLIDEDFEPIQVFNGLFFGEGHTISGYSYTGSGYVIGFIRYIGESGKVQNLKLQASIDSTDEKECVGGIAGINYGEIAKCEFIGTVQGENITGGIVGINENTGLISNCVTRGRITGSYATGGIAGQNHGQIRSCDNRAGINDNTEWVQEDDEIGLGLLHSLDGLETNVRVYSGVDTGGIAGYSDGSIALCQNYGRVGYEHTGYNIGGIAGRQTGMVDQCKNYGVINGRKDIGGIVGQMEPYVELNEADSLRAEVDKLHDLVERTINDMEAGKNAVRAEADLLKSYSDEALDTGKELTDHLSDFVDENLEETEKVTGRMEQIVEMLPTVFDNADAAMNHAKTLGETLRKVNGDLAVADRIEDEAMDESRMKRMTLTASVGGRIMRAAGVSMEPTAGDEVTVLVVPDIENGYRLAAGGVQVRDTKGQVLSVEVRRDADKEQGGLLDGEAYTFTMPAENVIVTAQFEPVSQGDEGWDTVKDDIESDSYWHWVRVSSNPGGACDVRVVKKKNVDGNDIENSVAVTITVKPDASYTLSENPVVKDSNGQELPLQKNQAGSDVYSFDITDKNTVSPVSVEISFARQTKQETVDAAVDNLPDIADDLQDASKRLQDCLDKIRDNGLTVDAIKDELPELLEALGDMETAGASALSSLSTLLSIYGPVVTDAMKAANADLNAAISNAQGIMDAADKSGDGVRAIVNYLNAQEDIRFTKLGEDFDQNRGNLHHQLQNISDCVGRLSDNASYYSDKVMDDLREVNDQVNHVLTMLINRVEDYSESGFESIYEDISDEELDEIAEGKVEGCVNKGVVSGDINVGGVAGSIAIDEEDPEGGAAGTTDYAVGNRYVTRCVIGGSVNEGFVTAKKDGAGGIVGYMKIGVVTDSEGYGSVESTEGDYVGGICGQSFSVIRRCYVIADVSGGRNVGGIAGYGDRITDCCAIANVEASIDRSGAIAGQVSSYEGTNSKVLSNYFVGDRMCGIDSISYVGVAEPITYEEMLAVEGLPLEFRHLKVTYRAGDESLGNEEVEYGAPLSGLTLPEIPYREGYYGVWPDVTDEYMEGNRVLEAEYFENVTVVQSGMSAADVSEESSALETENGQRPYALVEHVFTADTSLNVHIDGSMTPPEEVKGEYRVYVVSLENSGLGSDALTPLRLYNPWKKARVWSYAGNGWQPVESKARGQYLQIELVGEQGTYCVAEEKTAAYWIWIAAIGGGAAAAVLVLVKCIRKARRRRVAKKKEKESSL